MSQPEKTNTMPVLTDSPLVNLWQPMLPHPRDAIGLGDLGIIVPLSMVPCTVVARPAVES